MRRRLPRRRGRARQRRRALQPRPGRIAVFAPSPLLTWIPKQRIGTCFGSAGQANWRCSGRPFHHGISMLGSFALRMTGL